MTIAPSRPPQTTVLSFETGPSMVAGARLVLAGIVLVAYLIDIPGQVFSSRLTWAVISGYLLYSLALYGAPKFMDRLIASSRQPWVDLAWYGLLTAVTDPGTSGIFLFFLFAIVAASFRQGTVAGVGITLGSVAVYLGILFLLSYRYASLEWAALILRSFFLVSLGLMIASWGGKELSLKRRLALLREINALSNPRFGAEQALGATMAKFRAFFDADTCLILFHESEHERHVLRESTRAAGLREAETVPEEMARLLQPYTSEQAVIHGPGGWRLEGQRSETRIYDMQHGGWRLSRGGEGANLAELLNTAAFLSVPLQAGKDTGRIYLCSNRRRFRDSEAVFLAQAAEQAFRLIEHVKILDRMASAAAAVERKRIVTDLHDTAIQPYIGLKMGLEALRAQASRDNPLVGAIDKLLSMTSGVIGDLRSYVRNLEQHHVAPSNALLGGLHERARRFFDDFGIRVELELPERLELSDRLAAEILQFVSEGVSNVRKHTAARHCRIRLARKGEMLSLEIANPWTGTGPQGFVPRSMTTRAQALGGRAEVRLEAQHTRIHITIPT